MAYPLTTSGRFAQHTMVHTRVNVTFETNYTADQVAKEFQENDTCAPSDFHVVGVTIVERKTIRLTQNR